MNLLSIEHFVQRLADPFACLALFDHFDALTYFVKDERGRYLAVNETLRHRCGQASKESLLGRTSREVYPQPLGDFFLNQDLQLLQSGQPLINEMEQHPYPSRQNGWCLTTKLPLFDDEKRIIGLVGMSRDIQSPDQDPDVYASVALVIRHVRENLDQPLPTSDLAELAGLSVWQLDQRLKELFQFTTAQLVLQSRMDSSAKMLLESKHSIMSIALSIGYGDQSAFTRQFRKTFGMTPGEYRRSREFAGE